MAGQSALVGGVAGVAARSSDASPSSAGDRLRAAGVNLKSLAIIESAEPGNIVFRGED